MSGAEFDAEGWSTIFDPGTLRVFSLLPDADADEAYCTRHSNEMHQFDPIVHHEGGLYTTAESFSVYVCQPCLRTLPANPTRAYRHYLAKAFQRWDAGEAPAQWFQYLTDGAVDEDAGAVLFQRGEA